MRDERSGVGTGVLLITIGLLFMADRQGYMSFHRLWPVILIVLGAINLLFPGDRAIHVGVVAGRRGASRRVRSRFSSGIWLIFIGCLFLAHQNHWLSIRESWPLFIVAGGLAMIACNIHRRPAEPAPGDQGNDQQAGGQWP
jgi:hypothetical protein